MTHATVSQLQAGSSRLRQQASIDSRLHGRGIASTDDDVGRSCAGKAQATNHGSNAQSQNIFLHKNYLQ
ncbi:hypothetical protein [Delftia sp.]|uniref:hypothetical protein n=1 Tax=Delftia sp. TaxID=1886637 RepID=UPI00259C7EE3|nr:hypothetical protein [Delftia sp.]